MSNTNTTISAELINLKGTQFVDDFSKEIFEQTYAYGKEDINQTFERVAKNLASIETDKEFWQNQFQWALEDFKFVPGGRITSNAGTGLKGTSYINCFVSGFEGTHRDSMEGILAELRRQALILKSEGGYGFCADTMRPRGGFVDGIGNETPGAVRMLDMWDTQSAVITAGSGQKTKKEKAKIKIRKGAQMVTMSIWHPDIEEFITSKQTPGRLTKFNMSVLITDAFMEAVQNNKPWDLVFPDFDSDKKRYDKEWDGYLDNWLAKGYPVKVYKTFENANELWDMIMQSTYNRNEPGVLFVDTINRLNNLYYAEKICATNPCLTDDSWIHTTDGPQQVKNLIGNKFNAIVNGNVYSSTNKGFFFTGVKQTYRLKTKKGFELTLTNNHPLKKVIGLSRYITETEWSEVNKLNPGDKIVISNHRKHNSWGNNTSEESFGKGNFDQGWLVGNLLGDGYFNNEMAVLNYWGENKYNLREIAVSKIKNNFVFSKTFGNYSNSTVLEEERDEVAITNRELAKFSSELITRTKDILSKTESMSSLFVAGFLSGWFDADGSVQGSTDKGISIRLSSSKINNLKVAQRMLLRLGIVSAIYENRREEGVKKMPDGKGGEKFYKHKSQHELIIANDNIFIFADVIGFKDSLKDKKLKKSLNSYKRSFNRERFIDEIESITIDTLSPVYDCTIPGVHEFDANGFNVHNCGEQLLPSGGVCLLGSLNVTQFINFEKRDWDYDKLAKVIPIAIRFMDNVNDVTYVPLEIQRENLKNKRRIGLGVMGYGSALMMLKMRYGSKEALKLTEKLEQFIANHAYQASAKIASEKGSFPLFDVDKYLAGNFVKNLSKETVEIIRKNGLRNSHLLSIQPTGNSSIFANVVSGGLEPVFLPVYIRTSMMPYPPTGLFVPKNVDWINKKYDVCETDWTWIKEGDDNLLKTEFSGYTWKFDRDRGLLRETVVKDYAVRFLEEKGEWDASADWAATTTQLSVDEHVNTMGIFAKYVDSAISKTTNLPFEYPYDDFKDTYMKAYNTETIKGFTTYRAGTMTEVLGSLDKKNQTDENGAPLKIVKTTAPKRPKTLPCDIYQVTANGEKWIVLVGIYENDPYEVFAFKPISEGLHLPTRLKNGFLTKIKKGRYDLQCEGGLTIEDLSQHFETTEQEALTRMVSAGLRHGVDPKFILEQLNKSEGTIVSFAKAIARTLKKYIPEDGKLGEPCPNCGEQSLVFQEGCMVCLQCSASKC